MIDPLFMDSLNSEFEEISKTADIKKRNAAPDIFHNKISSLKFLDEAVA